MLNWRWMEKWSRIALRRRRPRGPRFNSREAPRWSARGCGPQLPSASPSRWDGGVDIAKGQTWSGAGCQCVWVAICGENLEPMNVI